MAKGERIIVALDVNSIEELEKLIDKLRPVIKIIKIGSELFTSCGIEAVDVVRRKGCKPFLDLKYHDIPNTVKNAGLECLRMGVKIFNLHASGGRDMMMQCAESVREEAVKTGKRAPIMLAVTLLTSMDKGALGDLGIDQDTDDFVKRLALLARDSGMDGVVCSAQEALLMREKLGHDFLLITPGIRPKGSDSNDQQRIMTPVDAIRNGSSYLVIGRPITQSDNPVGILRTINSDISLFFNVSNDSKIYSSSSRVTPYKWAYKASNCVESFLRFSNLNS